MGLAGHENTQMSHFNSQSSMSVSIWTVQDRYSLHYNDSNKFDRRHTVKDEIVVVMVVVVVVVVVVLQRPENRVPSTEYFIKW